VPPAGIAIVPVTMGAGLTPGDAISVEPKGMPVGETVEPVVMPSGEVTPMLGVGLTIPLTCALATLQATSAGRTAAIDAALTRILRFVTDASGAWLSDIGQPPWRGVRAAKIGSGSCSNGHPALVQLPLPRIESRKPFLFGPVHCVMRIEISRPRLNVNDRRRGGGRRSCLHRAGLGSDAT
jgi:hypothetical protein